MTDAGHRSTTREASPGHRPYEGPGSLLCLVAWYGQRTVELCQHLPAMAPIQPWEFPKKPWSRIYIDYAGPVDGHNYVSGSSRCAKQANSRTTILRSPELIVHKPRVPGLHSQHVCTLSSCDKQYLRKAYLA